MSKTIKLYKPKRFINKEIYLGCSGGVDSMVLLNLLVKYKFNFTVLHVNYSLRNEESDKDENFLREYCKNNNIKIEVYKVSLIEKNHLLEGNLQEKAREIRYNWFNQFLKNKNSILLLAHNLDDQIETFFQNLARKSGVNGLSCMMEKNTKFYRPLLDYSKSEIVEFAKKNNISWREDSSNFSSKYTRNKLRNIILPELYLKIPSLKNSILYFIIACQKTNFQNKKIVNNLLKKNKYKKLYLYDWAELNNDQKLLFLNHFGFTPNQLSEIEKLSNTQKGKKISNEKYSIYKELDFFSIHKNKKKSKNKSIFIEEIDELPLKFDKNFIFLDADKVKGNLKIRKWKIGDRIDILGLNGSKLISDIIKDAKLSIDEKINLHVLYDENHIYYCEGLAISKHSLAKSTSTKILKISII